jgi:hypothetical protein
MMTDLRNIYKLCVYKATTLILYLVLGFMAIANKLLELEILCSVFCNVLEVKFIIAFFKINTNVL